MQPGCTEVGFLRSSKFKNYDKITPPPAGQIFRLILPALFFMFLFSCNKEQAIRAPDIPEKEQLSTMQEKRQYLNHHLKAGGREIAKALTNPAFKEALMTVVVSPNNEEHAITFKQLLSNATLNSYFDANIIQASIYAFKDLDGKDWSPSIRLHMPEKETDPNQIGLFNVNSGGNFDDLFAINEGWPENEMPQVPAMEFINGELWPVNDFYLTEANIDDQPVWVLELDESGLDVIMNNPLFGPQTCTNNNEPTFKSSISTMTIKERKEHWLAGRSDIHIMRGTTWKTPNFSPNNASITPEIWNLGKTRKYKVYQGAGTVDHCIADSDGDRIDRFHHRDIKSRTLRNVNFELMKSWKPIFRSDQDVYTYLGCNKATCVIKGNIMYYTIFEFDGWPAPERTATIPNPASINGSSMQVQFRSWDGYYDKGYIDYVNPNGTALTTNIKGYDVNTHRISFKTKIN